MPIYEYGCRECGTDFEKFVQGQTAVVCPSCQSTNVIRRLSLFGAKTGGRFEASTAAMSGGCCGGGCGCR